MMTPRRAVATAMLALMFLTTPAHAFWFLSNKKVPPEQHGGDPQIVLMPGDSTTRVVAGTDLGGGHGAIKIDDALRDRDFLLYEPSIMNNLVQGVQEDNCDSTAAYDTKGAKHLALAFYPRVDDSISVALLRIRVQGHVIQVVDSSSAFAWSRWKLGGATGPDTIGSSPPSLTTAALHATPLFRDFLVWCQIVPGSNAFQGMWIEIVDPRTGEWFHAPFVSFNIEVVETYDASLNARTVGPSVRWRADLVGWR